jgi:hypothetical protein
MVPSGVPACLKRNHFPSVVMEDDLLSRGGNDRAMRPTAQPGTETASHLLGQDWVSLTRLLAQLWDVKARDYLVP